ncbi:50S ribosome-binding GTPase (plasmid) [Bacillus sp. CMF21]|nr:50S ribosome-binding GTPase [Bacillus sp. CMF21]
MVQKELTNEVIDTLKQCSHSAEEAYIKVFSFRNEVLRIIQNLSMALGDKTEDVLNDPNAKNFEFSSILVDMMAKLTHLSEEGFLDLDESLNRKKLTLNHFSISLFGRTKAGKSTIREALTKGSGGTIGKGSQRTTRDIINYSWNGLRIIDVPGIEAFDGDEDTQKALDIIDESDLIIFLTTDDAVQPGEFAYMSRLQEINKRFFIVMNVKHNLISPETNEPDPVEVNRFFKKPERIFAEDRLNEHQQHISQHVKTYLGIQEVDLILVHAQSAFMSTQPLNNLDSEKLWNLSQMDQIYQRIVEEINRYGKHRRVLTFYDSMIYFVETLEKTFQREQRRLHEQGDFIAEKKVELKNFFDRFVPESNYRVTNYVEKLFHPLERSLLVIIEEYIGSQHIQSHLEAEVARYQRKIDNTMRVYMEDIVAEFNVFLNEFTRQFNYDVTSVHFSIDSEIGRMKKGQMNKILKWSGIVTGVAAGAVSLVLPGLVIPAGLATAALSLAFAETKIKKKENHKWLEAKQQAKASLLEDIQRMKTKTIASYRYWIHEKITVIAKREITQQITSYLESLNGIRHELEQSAKDMQNLKNNLNKNLFLQLLQLEGLECSLKDIHSIAREQGNSTKIILAPHLEINETLRTDLNRLCGEKIVLISQQEDLRTKISKAIYARENIAKSHPNNPEQ